MFRLSFISRRRSAGVPVTRAAFRYIRRGDRARARADWNGAASAYQCALEEMPDLSHIWIQYGHAAKEAGDWTTAVHAYDRAAALRPDDPEPHMFLGHMAKRRGMDDTARHYLNALRRAPSDLSAVNEVMQQLLGRRINDAAMIDEALALLCIEREAVAPAIGEKDHAEGTVFFDVTDLMSFFGFSRIPSGVQRLQMEVILALSGIAAGRPVVLCSHSAVRRGWSVLPQAAFVELCDASRRSGPDAEAEWAQALRTTYIGAALSDDLAFPKGAVLISLGANAPNPNYLLDVRTARDRQNIAYVPMIHDLIPDIFPQWVAPIHARDFRVWLASIVHSASGFLANSNATKSDLLDHAARTGDPIAEDAVRVVRLDGFSLPVGAEPSAGTLARRGLEAGRYVLFVSTIEPRKNHVGAFRAWLSLARRVGEERCPKLVCVGGKGWLNAEVHETIARHQLLRRKVVLLHDVGDGELALLYRDCAFTLYPSFYEGWGLPITESLCRGKVPAASNTSSMPEVAGDLGVYFNPADPEDVAAALVPLVSDPVGLAQMEARIAEYRPRSWAEIGTDLVRSALAIVAEARPIAPPGTPSSGVRYSLALGGSSDARNGELFRHGTGWSLPGDMGCRVEAPDALLRFVAPDQPAMLQVELVAGTVGADYAIRHEERVLARGTIKPGETRLVDAPILSTDTTAPDPTGHAPVPRVTTIEVGADPAGVTVASFTLIRKHGDRSHPSSRQADAGTSQRRAGPS